MPVPRRSWGAGQGGAVFGHGYLSRTQAPSKGPKLLTWDPQGRSCQPSRFTQGTPPPAGLPPRGRPVPGSQGGRGSGLQAMGHLGHPLSRRAGTGPPTAPPQAGRRAPPGIGVVGEGARGPKWSAWRPRVKLHPDARLTPSPRTTDIGSEPKAQVCEASRKVRRLSWWPSVRQRAVKYNTHSATLGSRPVNRPSPLLDSCCPAMLRIKRDGGLSPGGNTCTPNT